MAKSKAFPTDKGEGRSFKIDTVHNIRAWMEGKNGVLGYIGLYFDFQFLLQSFM